MITGEKELALLAELKDMPHFVLLLELLKEFEEDVLGELAGQKEEAGLVRITRFYQCLRAIRSFLQARPEAAFEELKRVRETYFGENYDPEIEIPGDVIRQRFNPQLPKTIL